MSFSLQVGEAEPQEEVLMMCDDPTNQHFFKVKNYIELLELKERLLASLCDGKDNIIGSAHKILVLIVYAQNPHLKRKSSFKVQNPHLTCKMLI